jgi:hypothetical protein
VTESRKILIVLHEKDPLFDATGCLIAALGDEWRKMGLVTEFVRGVHTHIAADLVIPHIDLTVTPPEYRTFLGSYRNLVNRELLDISKSIVSQNLISRGDSYDGPVIVKTDRNYGGLPERYLASQSGRSDDENALLKNIDYMNRGDYPVFASLDEVPPELAANGNLVVEKFLPEILGRDYCIRYYYFFGSAGISLLFRSSHQVEKGDTAHSIEEVEVPARLLEMRERLGADYGKFDYTLQDGEARVFDVNRTPGTSVLKHWGYAQQVVERLAPGILSMLPAQT